MQTASHARSKVKLVYYVFLNKFASLTIALYHRLSANRIKFNHILNAVVFLIQMHVESKYLTLNIVIMISTEWKVKLFCVVVVVL